MTSEQISAFAGVLLSLAFSYIPGLREWFERLDSTRKRAIMALALLIVALLATAASCLKIVAAIDCTQAGIVTLAQNFLFALIASQSVYLISPPVGGDTLPPEHRK